MEITVEKMIENASNLGGSDNPAVFAKGPSTVDGQWIERSRCMMCMLVPFQIVSYGQGWLPMCWLDCLTHS